MHTSLCFEQLNPLSTSWRNCAESDLQNANDIVLSKESGAKARERGRERESFKQLCGTQSQAFYAQKNERKAEQRGKTREENKMKVGVAGLGGRQAATLSVAYFAAHILITRVTQMSMLLSKCQ